MIFKITFPKQNFYNIILGTQKMHFGMSILGQFLELVSRNVYDIFWNKLF